MARAKRMIDFRISPVNLHYNMSNKILKSCNFALYCQISIYKCKSYQVVRGMSDIRNNQKLDLISVVEQALLILQFDRVLDNWV